MSAHKDWISRSVLKYHPPMQDQSVPSYNHLYNFQESLHRAVDASLTQTLGSEQRFLYDLTPHRLKSLLSTKQNLIASSKLEPRGKYVAMSPQGYTSEQHWTGAIIIFHVNTSFSTFAVPDLPRILAPHIAGMVTK